MEAHLWGGFVFPPQFPLPRVWGKPKVRKICPFPTLIRHSCWSLALISSGLVGNKGCFRVSLGFQFRYCTVAVLRGLFGLLRGRTKPCGELQSCRGHSDLVARRIS